MNARPVPLLDLGAQLATIEAEIKQAVLDVIDSTCYVGGERVEHLEAEIAKYVGSAYAVGVSSGTDALLASLMALDIGPGDLVLTTPYSFFATAGVIARLHARPVFIDIDPNSYTIDPASIADWLSENPTEVPKVKAILPVHLYGQCADMDPILRLGAEFGIPIVEDAAQALGSKYPSEQGTASAGSMGCFGCFSFFPSKNLGAIGDGGVITTSDTELYEKLQILRNHGAEPKYYHRIVGGNFRLDPIQAAVVHTKLPYLNSWHGKRQSNARYYRQRFSHPQIRLPRNIYDEQSHIYNQFIIEVPEKRDELRHYLREQQIGHEVYYPLPLHLQECFSSLGYRKGDLPLSEHAAEHTLALPIYPELTTEMQDQVVQAIESFYS